MIRNKRLGRLTSLKSQYLAIAELFIEIMSQYSNTYTMEMAHKERGNLMGEWWVMRWLTIDLRDVIEAAMHSLERNIITEVGYLPIAIAHRAVRKQEHYLFQKSFSFLTFLYLNGADIGKQNAIFGDFVKERCSIYLTETAEYLIEQELEKIDKGIPYVENARDFAIELLVELQNLIKLSYDQNDLKSFNNFISAGTRIFRHFRPSEESPDADHLKRQREYQGLSDADRAAIDLKIDKQSTLELIEKEILARKGELFFGLTSFMINEYRDKPDEYQKLDFLKSAIAALPNDLVTLSEIYTRTLDFKTEEFWGWTWWGLPMDGETHSVDFFGKLKWLYAFKSLDIISKTTSEQLAKISLPSERNFVDSIAGANDPVRQDISAIIANINKWECLIAGDAVFGQKMDSLFRIYDQAKQRRIVEDEEFLINLSLAKLDADTSQRL